MNNKKSTFSTIILLLVLIIGLSLLLYPTFSDWWNSRVQSKAIANYSEMVSGLNEEDYSHIWQDAKAYNQSLLTRPNAYLLSEEQREQYGKLLNVTENGIMGFVEIPTINVSLPIYHGTSESVL